VDLFAFQFDLNFDGTVLNANTVQEGPFLQTGGATFFLPGSIDNTLGVVGFNANSLLGAVLGVSGDGILVNFEFSGISPGVSLVSLSNVTLLDSALNPIPYSTIEGLVTVEAGGGEIPEPSTLTLVPAGILLTLLRRRLFPGAK